MIDLSDREALKPLGRLLSALQNADAHAPLLLVGAAARDLWLVHFHGIAVNRATEDTDIALAVPSWDEFRRVRTSLLASGFSAEPHREHRLWFGKQGLDLIPFDGVERADRRVAWPPEGAEVMNVSGFREALATAVSVRLPGGLSFDIASLPALAVLKVWAWRDRRYGVGGKDAIDLWLLLRHYAEAGNEDRLYGRICCASP